MISRSILYMFPKSVRDKYRLDMPENVYAEMGYDDKKRLGRLVNLSSQGACIEFIDKGELPPSDSDTILQFLLPEQHEPISLRATVVWTRQLSKDTYSRFVNLGVIFNELDADTYACIWDFIVDSVSQPIH